MRLLVIASFFAVLSAAFFLVLTPSEIEISPSQFLATSSSSAGEAGRLPPAILPPGATAPTLTATSTPPLRPADADTEKQLPLASPPEVVKGIYLTAWSAGSATTVNRAIDLIKRTELNAVVIDIKDFSGHVSYKTGIREVEATGAENDIRITRPNVLIKKLHDAGIYVIARQTVFQDPLLAKKHPEWALKNASTSETWTDHKGLAWMDAAAKPVWDYNVAIAKDALSRGFDEVNFDYIRFASDGNMDVIEYPFWDGTTPRNIVIRNFFKYLRENLPGAKISADLFGLSTISAWDLGIGQIIEDAYEYFDYVSPMVYPSHYAKGFIGYQNPAEHPYEVVRYSMYGALARLREITGDNNHDNNSGNVGSSTVSSSTVISYNASPSAKLRPWLQDFDLGAVYGVDKVKVQIQAVEEILANENTAGAYYAGWLLWDPANKYTGEAIKRE